MPKKVYSGEGRAESPNPPPVAYKAPVQAGLVGTPAAPALPVSIAAPSPAPAVIPAPVLAAEAAAPDLAPMYDASPAPRFDPLNDPLPGRDG
jgi:hypothetical protein